MRIELNPREPRLTGTEQTNSPPIVLLRAEDERSGLVVPWWYLDEEGVGAPDGVVVVGEDDGAEAVGVVAMHLVLCSTRRQRGVRPQGRRG